jgi:sirohydrochlorin ferrochelatase
VGLRTVLVVALAGWAGWLLFRGLATRKVPWIGLALLALPLIWLGVTERQWVSAEQAFTRAARAVAPASDGVHCQRLGETFTYAGADLGHVRFDEAGDAEGAAVVSYETCQRLRAYWESSQAEKVNPPFEQVVAVHVLTHEAVHLTGVQSESLTECRALQRDTLVARALGASPEAARVLARRYAALAYPRMPSAYRSSDCREDGAWDETPGDGVWP